MEWLDSQALQKVDYVRVRYFLEFTDDFELTDSSLLQLRRELKSTSRLLPQSLSDCCAEQLSTLFSPAPIPDPLVRRTFPISPPAFVIQVPAGLPVGLVAGDSLPLEVVFWGEGRRFISLFHSLLSALGRQGLHCGSGEFFLIHTEAATPDGTWEPLYFSDTRCEDPELPILRAVDLVESTGSISTLQFRTPARLLVAGKPLFRPTLNSLLPFFLRRVTGMCYAWCGVELAPDARGLLANLAVDQGPCDELHWQDWRTMDQHYSSQDLGGLTGQLVLADNWQQELGPLFALGSLLNLGKGAAYGGGAWDCLH